MFQLSLFQQQYSCLHASQTNKIESLTRKREQTQTLYITDEEKILIHFLILLFFGCVSFSSRSSEESLRSLSLDHLNLLINGQAFSDVTFSVEGRLVHAHRCILAARSLFFRKFFCGGNDVGGGDAAVTMSGSPRTAVIPVNSVGYEIFLLMLQFLYSGQVSIMPQKHEPRPNCGERGYWHTHCSSAVDFALDTLEAARSFGVEQLALLTQKQLSIMVEKSSIEDVMRVLVASRKQDMHHLWSTCSNLVAKSGLPSEVLAKHLPIDVVAKIEELRLNTSFSHCPSTPHHHHLTAASSYRDQKIRRMRRALDSSDVELVKLMIMGEGLNLDEALALHYAVENCTREVVKALLELGAADINYPASPAGKTPLHIAAELVSPDMVAVLLDHHADPTVRAVDGVTPLDVLRTLASDFLFKGAMPGMIQMESNKLRLCLELMQSAAMVIFREEGGRGGYAADQNHARSVTRPATVPAGIGLNLDSGISYLNLGVQIGLTVGKLSEGEECCSHGSLYHHHSHEQY